MEPPVVSCRRCRASLPLLPSSSYSSTRTHPSISSLSFRTLVSSPSLFKADKCSHSVSSIPVKPRATCSAHTTPPTKALRQILDSPGIHVGPACFDALSAKLVEQAGFLYSFIGGFSVSATRLGLPDTGFISYGEMVAQGEQICRAVSIPLIGDGDDGYGNAMNVKRTVKGYIRAGFAGIILDDQVSPKACGHSTSKKVVSREEAVMKIKAAVDARDESGSDFVIVARTESRQAVSFDESLWRARAFAGVGADVLFIESLASREEMKAFCEISPLVPKMAHMIEIGGKSPVLTPIELEELGYKIVAYPLSLMGASIRAMQDSLNAIKGGHIPPPGSIPSFEEIKEIVGFNTYYEEEKRYAIGTGQTPWKRGYSSASSNVYDILRGIQDYSEQRVQSPQDEVVSHNDYGAYGSSDPFSGIWSRKLRIKINGRDGFERLDVRIPAGFLDGITNIVPALGGVNLKEHLKEAAGEEGGKLLVDFNDTMGDRIKVFLE